jgi:hypothetical protein
MTICLISSFCSAQAGDGIEQPNLFFPHDNHGQQVTINGSPTIEFISQLLIKHSFQYAAWKVFFQDTTGSWDFRKWCC